MAKRAMALIFVLILSLNTFAATVSENDGSAFITKSEFDSLKNTFQSQIDSYNTGIDNKIDQAIAGYLSGIIVTTEGKAVSLIAKANKQREIKFCGIYLTPYTKIGGHYKAGGHIVYSRDSSCSVGKNSIMGDANSGYLAFSNGYVYMHGHHKIKMGLAPGGTGGNFDGLTIYERNTSTSQKNIIYKTQKDDDGYIYTDSTRCYDLTPQISLTSYTVGGGITANTIITPYTTYTPDWQLTSCTFYDFSGKEFGYQTTSLTWKLINFTTASKYPTVQDISHTINIANSASCAEATYPTNTNNAYIEYLAGKKIGTTEKIIQVQEDDWQTCHSSPISDDKTWYWDQQYKKPTDDTVVSAISEYANPVRTDVSSKGMATAHTWMKKYSDVLITDLVHKPWTSATGETVHYYSGIPICVSNAKQVIELKLKFTNSDSSNAAKFSIRKAEFTNVDMSSETTNVECYKNKDKTTAYTDFEIAAGATNVEKTIYLDAESGTTYWLKACPNGSGLVTVTTEDNFKTYSN